MEKAPTAAAPLRVIIDTDPGVDDALAILLALRSPELQVEAITPVAGNVPLEFTLPNALKLVEIAGRTDVPVAGGARHPLVRKLDHRGTFTGTMDWRAWNLPSRRSSRWRSRRRK